MILSNALDKRHLNEPGWYCARHLSEYRRYALSHIVLLGYLGVLALAVCSLSGIVVTWEGLRGIDTTAVWSAPDFRRGAAVAG